ncbi:thioredoxin domain-containing protein 11-like [Lytechinus variegatus]|uniref:thioredoxin domain-containing protein 11-like n=1 Tax=Lytechinus variegatus TaxID=7654 RepID=UPI001BB173C4|nr:thioredoxin domain-containing protein 11-like [Lytechinus variegatus]XP_041473521.1 thioredoxin domain-containing protein 11-like [Lytechinus variegatus]
MVKGWDWLRNNWMLLKEIMARNPELLSLFFALVLSGIVSHLDNPKGSKATPYVIPIPPKIFGPRSSVIEFPTGDMNSVRNVIASTGAEVWIIMYYAHWDAYSLETAKEFEKAAEKMSNQVLFMAVNCWYPYGGCRNKVIVPYFPIIFTHRDSREGIQYTGIQRAPEMVDHLERVCSPLKVVQDLESLRLLRAQHDAVVLAYFSYEGTLAPKGLASFQWAAMQHLEKDTIQPTPFAIITNKHLARSLGLSHSMNLTLLRNFNVSLFYPPSQEFKAKPILEFVTAHRESMVQWISPPGLKSTILSSHVFTRPTLIVFTPHQHDNVFANYFMMLREATLEYYNCANNSYIHQLQKVIQEERKKNVPQSSDSSTCKPSEDCVDQVSSGDNDCCQTLASRGRIESVSRARGNVCEICETFSQSLQPFTDPCTYLTSSSGSPLLLDATIGVTASSNACLYLNNFYSPFSHYRLCCQDIDPLTCDLCSPFHSSLHKHSLFSGSMHSPRTQTLESHFAPQHKMFDCSQRLSKDHIDSFTIVDHNAATSSGDNEQPQHSQSSRTTVFSHQENDLEAYSEGLQKKFEHLGCRTNRTLVFRAMRSEYFWSMADRLGLSSQYQHKNASVGVAIVDIQSETHHILPLDQSGLSLPLLKQFIIDYTESLLPRHRHSTSPSSTSPSTSRCTKASDDTVCITEVTEATYEDMVLNTSKDVLLLYYAPWCGSCIRIQHIYLKLAALFRSHDNLRVARINGDLNDLRWHLLTPAYPTILFFPAHDKSMSVRFPQESAITLPNLVDFVLKHSR